MTQRKLEHLKALHKASTGGTKEGDTWYSHVTSVRGPFCRWFEITEVEPEYQKHVGTKRADLDYCAAAMNSVPELIDYIETLKSELYDRSMADSFD